MYDPDKAALQKCRTACKVLGFVTIAAAVADQIYYSVRMQNIPEFTDGVNEHFVLLFIAGLLSVFFFIISTALKHRY